MDIRSIALQYVTPKVQPRAPHVISSSQTATQNIAQAASGGTPSPQERAVARHWDNAFLPQPPAERNRVEILDAHLNSHKYDGNPFHSHEEGSCQAKRHGVEGGSWCRQRADVRAAPSRDAPSVPSPSRPAPPPPPTAIEPPPLPHDSAHVIRTRQRAPPFYPPESAFEAPQSSFVNMQWDHHPFPSSQHHQHGRDVTHAVNSDSLLDAEDPLTTLMQKARAMARQQKRAVHDEGNATAANSQHASASAPLGIPSLSPPQRLEDTSADHGSQQNNNHANQSMASNDLAPTHIEGPAIGQLSRLRTAMEVCHTTADPALSLSLHNPKEMKNVMAVLTQKLNVIEHNLSSHQNAHIATRAGLVREGDKVKERVDDCDFRMSELEASADSRLRDLKARVESRVDTSVQLRENWLLKVKSAVASEIRAFNLLKAKNPHQEGASAETSSSVSPAPHDPSSQSPSSPHNVSNFKAGVEELREILLQYQTHADARMTSLQLMLNTEVSKLQNELRGASYLAYRRGGMGTSFIGVSYVKSALGTASSTEGGERLLIKRGNTGAANSTDVAAVGSRRTNGSASGEAQGGPIRFDNTTPGRGLSPTSGGAFDGQSINPVGAVAWLDGGDSASTNITKPSLFLPNMNAVNDIGTNSLIPVRSANLHTSMSATGGGLGTGVEDARNRFLQIINKVRAELAQLRIERTEFESHFIDRIVQFSTGGGLHQSVEGIALSPRGALSTIRIGAPKKVEVASKGV